MKSLRVTLSLIFLTAYALAAEPPVGKGFVSLKRDISFPDPAPAGFPKLAEKQELPCVAVLEDGFLVVAADSQGQSHVAFLPRRDEWGRATAETWILNSAIPSNTVVVTTPVQLKPGYVPLTRGSLCPLIAEDTNSWTVLFGFANFSRSLLVPRADAEFVPAPKPHSDPLTARMAQLGDMLKESKDMEMDLARTLEKSKSNANHVATLLRNLALSQTEVTRLHTEVSETETLCKELAGHTPELKTVPGLQQELKNLVQEQNKLAAHIEKTRVESEPLMNIQKRVLSVQDGIQALKTTLSSRQAELNALLKTCAGEGIKPDRDRVLAELDKADKQRTLIMEQVQHLDAAKGIFTNLYDHTATLTQENQEFQDKVRTLTEEIQQLKKKIQELLHPKSPGTPEAEDK